MPTPATTIPMLLHFAVLFSGEELVTVTEGSALPAIKELRLVVCSLLQ